MHQVIIRELEPFAPLGLPEIDAVLSGEAKEIKGEARVILLDAASYIRSGLSTWPDSYQEQKQRQIKKLRIIENKLLTS